jgi:hypothetical protein
MKKIFFVIFLITDVASAYKLLESFPTFMSRVFGFSFCVFFINALLIIWVKYLLQQPEDVQKEITVSVGERTNIVNRSLYEILHNSWTKKRRVFFLYGEFCFSLFILFFISFLSVMSFLSGKVNVFLEFKNAFSLDLLPYYVGFCLSGITTITSALLQNKKNDVFGPLKVEFMIKLIQAVFVTTLYEVGGPVFLLIVLTSFMRIRSREAIQEQK